MKKVYYCTAAVLGMVSMNSCICEEGQLEIVNEDNDGWFIYVDEDEEHYVDPEGTLVLDLEEGEHDIFGLEDNIGPDDSYSWTVDIEGCEEETIFIND